MEIEPEEDLEALIVRLDEALCSLLHEGNELGEHSPQTHLHLFLSRSQSAPDPSNDRGTWPWALARLAALERELATAREESAQATRVLDAVENLLPYLPSPDELLADARLNRVAKRLLAELVRRAQLPKGKAASAPPVPPTPNTWMETHPGCHSGRDGECNWSECPQLRDGEPARSGRHCPRDRREPKEGT